MTSQLKATDNIAVTVGRLVDAKSLAGMFTPPRCERTIRYWQAGRVIPFYKVGRAVLFDPQEVFAYLAKHNRVNPEGGVA